MLEIYNGFLWGMTALAVVVFFPLLGTTNRKPMGLVPDGISRLFCHVGLLALLPQTF